MKQRDWKIFVYMAFFLALAVLFQSIRLFFPMLPGPVNLFLIGSLVNMTLVLAVWVTDSYWAAGIGLFLPVVAFFQGHLPIALMIPVVGIGNLIFAAWTLRWRSNWLLWLAPFLKAAWLYAATLAVIEFFALLAKVGGVLSFMMSWPQIVTGLIGIWGAKLLARRLSGSRKFSA